MCKIYLIHISYFSLSQCNWTSSIQKLHSKTREYLNLFNIVPPTVDICCPRQGQTQYKANVSVKRHANNVLEIMRFKCQRHNDLYSQLKYHIGSKWKHDLLKKWNICISLSPKDTFQIQNASCTNDKAWSTIATMTNKALGWRLFSSHNAKFNFRKQIQTITGQIMDVKLERASFNNYDQRKHAQYTVYYMNDTEIMTKCLDKWVNNNQWVFMPHFNDTIWWTQGFDKATNGGLIMIIALVWKTLSVKDCMISLYIPGDVKENATNILKCHHLMNYPKQRHWQSLSKRPSCVTLVLYNVSDDGTLMSRYVQSCIVMINSKHQLQINELKSANDTIVRQRISQLLKPEHINHDQFDYSWSLNKTKKKRKHNNWQTALSELKAWEHTYKRPSDLKCMCETERLGDFVQHSMFQFCDI